MLGGREGGREGRSDSHGELWIISELVLDGRLLLSPRTQRKCVQTGEMSILDGVWSRDPGMRTLARKSNAIAGEGDLNKDNDASCFWGWIFGDVP